MENREAGKKNIGFKQAQWDCFAWQVTGSLVLNYMNSLKIHCHFFSVSGYILIFHAKYRPSLIWNNLRGAKMVITYRDVKGKMNLQSNPWLNLPICTHQYKNSAPLLPSEVPLTEIGFPPSLCGSVIPQLGALTASLPGPALAGDPPSITVTNSAYFCGCFPISHQALWGLWGKSMMWILGGYLERKKPYSEIILFASVDCLSRSCRIC